MLKKRPFTLRDCLEKAKRKFEKYFINDIKALIKAYPIDFKDKEGKEFWRPPKRIPHALILDLFS
jgi:hypothetical protein